MMNNINKYKNKINSLIKSNQNFFNDHKKVIKIAATIMIIVVALVFFADKEEKETIEIPKNTISDSGEKDEIRKNPNHEETKKDILIDISGSVIMPGVYSVKEGARLYDVITLAGGLTDNADIDAINQAELVSDGQKLYIPALGEEIQEHSYSSGSQNSSENGKININTATSEELQTISGIGPSTAQKIIEYRTINGKFSSIEEIKNVSGIGDKTFERLKEHLIV